MNRLPYGSGKDELNHGGKYIFIGARYPGVSDLRNPSY
jgi:hypothetical protein